MENISLTRQEWILMEALWEKHPAFLSDLMEALAGTLQWKRTTFQTYLKRLSEKGFVGFKEVRGSYSYFPLVSRGECVKNESKQLFSKMTGASQRLFLACMVEEGRLSEAGVAELRGLIGSLSETEEGEA